MTFAEWIARVEHFIRPAFSFLPTSINVRLFSKGRSYFLKKFEQASGFRRQALGFRRKASSIEHKASSLKPKAYSLEPITVWGIVFRLPLWNAAGMFKKGYGYDVVSGQGAGAFVAGTTTSRVRVGNLKNGVALPAVSYGHSASASNWLGLPNEAHSVVAQRLSKITRVAGCPIGASVAAEPTLEEEFALPELVEGMRMYEDAGVDYIELNESCPNVERRDSNSLLDESLIRRLNYVAENFLSRRMRRLPVVVKFSVDTNHTQLEELLRLLISLNFDGIILGNTSVQYAEHRASIAKRDLPLYDHFTSEYGGGLSGAILTNASLDLAAHAVQLIQMIAPSHEFNVIRCGGIMNADDIRAGAERGVLLNQWYVGYFEQYSKVGNNVYRAL